MSKVRVYEVAKQLNLDPKAVVALFQTIGVTDVRNHMSSVEPEQVERVKRHLEKQRTHDVVEEKVRTDGRVIKRRAVAKTTPADSPSGAIPPTPVSQLDVAAPRSVLDQANVDIPRSASSAAAMPSARSSAQLDDVVARESSARLPLSQPKLTGVAPQGAPGVDGDRKSTRDVEHAAVPQDRRSARALTAEPAVETLPVASGVPVPPSVRVVSEAQAPAHATPAPAAEAAPAPEPAPEPVRHEAPAPVVAVASEAQPASEPPVRQPKTGVEYWTGRPGVPMPTPVNAPRTGIGGGTVGSMPRRVQYDPRAGAQGPAGRGPMRGGAQQGRPMMGRPGGPGQRGGRFGGPPMRKPSGMVSTQEMSAHKKVIRIEENITLAAMAAKMSLKATELLMKLLGMGMTGVHINTTLDADTAKILASEFGWEVEDVAVSEEGALAEARGEEETTAVAEEGLVVRPPVVTVMGHVDHGKTSLLDKIRKANVAGGEAGGITQHIGAYKVQTQHGTIVFLDTPGHEAFTQMRARGASVTDLVVLVVAADDGVMPQTKEAVAHAKSAKVPIIVAVNKIDKPGAEPDRVKRELVDLGLQPEEWGGDTMFCNVSALTGEGIDHLLSMISLQSEVLELKANPKKAAHGTVLEALLDRGRGPVARVLVQDGTLHVGDFILAGPGFGKVRAMTNEHGKPVHEAGPATPVEILGLSDVPGAGDPMDAVKDPKKAQEIAETRKVKQEKGRTKGDQGISLQGLMEQLQRGDQQELRVIIKADVHGSIEALSNAFTKLSTDRVKLSIIHAGVGAITEGDINLAIAAKAIVVGFNVRPAGKAASLAEENKIEIRLYSIIYTAIDDVKSAMEGLLPATLTERASGKAEVRQIFKIKGIVVAGSYIIQGTFKRAGNVRVVRDGVVVHEGKVSALKRFKDDVKEVAEGFECGISVENFNDLKEKDILESYEIEEVKQKL